VFVCVCGGGGGSSEKEIRVPLSLHPVLGIMLSH
jgi:hypothetical protein